MRTVVRIGPKPSPESGPDMERVTGIGGVFFRARDLTALSAWYAQHLGVQIADGHSDFLWRDDDQPSRPGRTVWSLFPADTDYFGPHRPAFMINYRVANLERMLDQLGRGGVAIDGTEDYEYGRFAWVTDPEGNRVELWEPVAAA